ncbi:MAG: hypothetical protein ACK5JD_00980 [Mangrovibacterium sp.]
MRGNIRKFGLLSFLLAVFLSLAAQDAVFIPASVQAMGNTVVSLPLSSGFELNPAAAGAAPFELGMAYSSRFMLKELSEASAYAIAPLLGSTLQFGFSRFGETAYRETQFSFGVAKTLGKYFSGGLRMQYFTLAMAENDQRPGLLTFSLGVQYNRRLWGIGASVFNPLEQSMHKANFEKQYPSVYRLGLHRLFNNILVFSSALSLQSGEKLNSHWGIECRFPGRFVARAGLETSNSTWSLGVGWVFATVHADLSYRYHQYLGSSPSVTLYFRKQ